MKLRMTFLMALGALALILAALHQSAQAAPLVPQASTYIVGSTSDPVPTACAPTIGGYSCASLRSAVIAANANPGSTIQLTHGVTYTLTIAPAGADDATTGDLNITADTTFNFGNVLCLNNCAATLQGGAGWSDRILNIASSAHVDAFLLTLRNGNTTGNGGGILNAGTFTLTNSTIISNATTLNGGGIFNTGTFTLTDGQIISNTALLNSGGGGGLYNQGTVSLSSTNIMSNTASNTGGGFENDPGGVMWLSQSDVVGNYGSQVGGLINSGRLFMDDGMLRGNRSAEVCWPCVGGLYNDGQLVMTGTLIITNTGYLGALINMSVTQLSGVTVTQNDAGVGGIWNQGQMSIDHSAIVTNTSSYQGGGINNQGPGTVLTITNSIIRGNSTSNSANEGGGIFSLADLRIFNSDISNNRAAGRGGGLAAQAGNVLIQDSTVQGNKAQTTGGGIDIRCFGNSCASLTLIDSTVSGNTAQTDGGGLMTDDHSDVQLRFSTVSGNQANTGAGGGIMNAGNGSLILKHVTVNNNSAMLDGGGIYNAYLMDLTNSTLSGNHAYGFGGGLAGNIPITTTSAYLNNVTIAYNLADANNDGSGKGGGVAVITGTFSMRNTLIGFNSDMSSQAPDCSGVLTSDRVA